MAQAGPGKVLMEYEFGGDQDLIGATAVDGSRMVGPFRVVGQGMAEVDSGVVAIAGALGGAVRLTTTNEDVHTIGLETDVMWDVALMGPLVAEARVQFQNFTTKAAFMGFTDIAIGSFVPDIETDILTAASATLLTLTASDLVGFYGPDAEITATPLEYMGVYNGGATAGETTAASVNLGTPISVAGEWQVIRIEIDPNGDARWFVDGKLKQSVAKAVSTTVDLKFFIAVGSKHATTIATMDLGYLRVWGNRDWTV